MLETFLNFALSFLVSTVKDPANVTQTEWDLIESLNTASSELLAKKPATMT